MVIASTMNFAILVQISKILAPFTCWITKFFIYSIISKITIQFSMHNYTCH